MNDFVSSIACHQKMSTSNTSLPGDDGSEKVYVESEIAEFSSSLLLNYDHSCSSVPINIPQSHHCPLDTSIPDNDLNDLVYKSLSSNGSDSSSGLDNLLVSSYESFGSNFPTEELVNYFDMLGVQSPIGSNLECLSPESAQSPDYSIIGSPSPIPHFGSPTSQETVISAATAAAQLFTNMSLNNLADSLQSNSTDNNNINNNMQLELELAEILPQQQQQQQQQQDILLPDNSSSFDVFSLSPSFSDNSQIVLEDHGIGSHFSSPPNELESMGFSDVNLFSHISSPSSENGLTLNGESSIPGFYYCANSPQTPQNSASDPLISFESLFDNTSDLNLYPDLAETEWNTNSSITQSVTCQPLTTPLSQQHQHQYQSRDHLHHLQQRQQQQTDYVFSGYYRPMSAIHTSSATGKQTKIYKCPFCNHTSNRGNNMREHIQIHNPQRPKPFTCSLCERSFARKHDMNRHYLSCKKQNEKKASISGGVVPLS